MSPAERSTGRGLPLEILWEATELGASSTVRGGPLPASLAARYGSRLQIPLRPDRPTIVANFVESLDGVVALGGESVSGGGEISGFFEPDRFLMGLLRAAADVVVVGGGTVRAGRTHVWAPRQVNPAATEAYAEWRRAIGLSDPQPRTVIVTASGEIQPDHAALQAPDVPVTLLTNRAGAKRLAAMGLPAWAQALPVVERGPVPPAAIVAHLTETGVALALCEGGPHLLGDLVRLGALDEQFLTLAPQLLGRDGDDRFSFVEGIALPAGGGDWGDLVSVRRAQSHLFLRYRFDNPDRPA
ncbi:MAG TPA: dihydrofolate reductase family protein [Candidatus Saccharimonadales bacterium]|nr:dihydrofolate reductase family protein [Candidatus Saccharimonadales bacterium]